MALAPVSDDALRETVSLYLANGNNQQKTADALGLARSTVQNRLTQAARKGLLPPAVPTMPGFEVTRLQTGPRGTTIEQRPEKGEVFEIPEGHRIKGVSAFIDPDGRLRGQWVKTREGEPSPERTAEIIQAAFEKFEPKAPNVLPPRDSDSDRLTTYIFCDWHVGLFAYGKETGGPDWDLSIARQTLSAAVKETVETSPPSGRAIILGLGDLLHADNGRNQTERSGNVLDVDTRYSKCLETVCDLMAESSELIASKHNHVEAVFKPGNHDENSTVGIRQALRMYWRQNERVTVDTSPDAFYWRRFGVNLIGGTHGDKAKIPDLPMIMANRRKEDWGATTTRHIHTGHIHHDTLREIGGVHVYSHRAPVAQDAYHAWHGYLSGRSMKSYTYHVDKGARGHSEVEIS
ncbi:hypothetical protein SMB554_07230 [Sinorhizobium meliloti]|uniref:helix-turn-helix domain-containing protein n=1 Tax=Rhizobium meliloti TaxID=382 RepID=UPI000B5A4084|nr:helix-turn-helix domain-containing protein [Sinorhizobium meliloti]ASJ59003.1 hypothetical protein SMB554_07230 [Sinorhizobium meliloti]MCK3783469.1 helix-turn-helix domain-containing protein [Sinorhizobium meliloti]MCK3787901.1 helix-turn-helix domain-containing protein [Sinorhizobium meliloti]MCK3794822.1 helix-turn-helix domain-containing protein [Sinorhizobium meliloti]